MRLVDLSHVIDHHMATYPGLLGPEIEEYLTFDASHAHYAAGTEFAIKRISMVANTGTYLDTPAHRFRDGHDLSDLPLERCADLPAVVVNAGPGPIGATVFSDVAVTGSAVLQQTAWDRHWGSERYGDRDHPYLTEAGAQVLADRHSDRRAPHRPGRGPSRRGEVHRRTASRPRARHLPVRAFATLPAN